MNSVGTNGNNRVYLHTLQCRKCGEKVRLGHHQLDPVVNIGNYKYCPSCGAEAFSGVDSDRDFWETLADSYGIAPEFVQEAYKLWDRNEYQRFGEFISALKKEAGIA